MACSKLYLGGISMATATINAVQKCKELIDAQTNFVLQGGAGSGKTEALKELLVYIAETNPNAKVLCITYTNNAVDEIRQRTNNVFPVSTIHSFLHDLIKLFTKNIKAVIHELYIVPLMERSFF